jgi:type I restriction enzyme R subunit
MKFTEAHLEEAIIDHLVDEGYPHVLGDSIKKEQSEVLILDDIKSYLTKQYAANKITSSEIDAIIRDLQVLPSSDLYESNKQIMKWLSNGFDLKREDRSQKDLHINLIDFNNNNNNIYKIVNQLEIVGYEKRIPDSILYINGIPLVVFEFKSAIREDATIKNAYDQLTIRYRRDIPELLKYNAFCIISDGINNKAGSLFAPYEFYYAWRRAPEVHWQIPQQAPQPPEGGDAPKSPKGDFKRGGFETSPLGDSVSTFPLEDQDSTSPLGDPVNTSPLGDRGADGINSLYTMIKGMFNKERLSDIIHHFVFMPDKSSHKEEKILCRYPQYYAATKLYKNIIEHRKPEGDGKGGTYFGATGCGKSYTMLFLTRLLMKSIDFSSPTIVLITDRTDLDDQLSGQFTNAKEFVGDNNIVSVESRKDLRDHLQDRSSGGVFLTTIHKFTEDAKLLSDRTNIICISDEAHRSQVNLDQKITITENGVKKTYGFAKYLHDSLPNATYVGFTGTPVDATLDVFGEVVDAYTMTESVKDEITVKIVYEGRAARVVLDNSKLKEIEEYYSQCVSDGASEYQVEESKRANTNMSAILGDPDRLKALAKDFVSHYETRIEEGATVKAKAIFVSSGRQIAYNLYKEIIMLRPDWAVKKISDSTIELSDNEKKKIKPIERLKMIMTRGKDDEKALYDILGTKEYRKGLDTLFKNEKSNFKIAIVVDMWLTGFDVPFLDAIYIDKPIQKHSLIQTISRVNRRFEGKQKGLVVDYIGIKKQMNQALAHYSKSDSSNFEEIEQSIVVVRDHLDLLEKMFHSFNKKIYFTGSSVEQLEVLNKAAEFVQISQKQEKRFMNIVKRLKAAYDICCGNEVFGSNERDHIHFYLAVRSIVYKLTKGTAPDAAQMNAKVREMIHEALQSDGVEEILKMGSDQAQYNIFDDDYLEKIGKIKLPNTKIKLLQQLLKKAIDEFKKVNKTKGVDFSEKFTTLVNKYNEREETDTLRSEVMDDFADEIINLYNNLRKEKNAHVDIGISFEEKAFYDILLSLAHKYDFEYPEDKLIILARAVKQIVDDKAKYTDWNQRDDIKAELKADLIILLAEHGYPPVDRDEVYKEIFEQAENYKKGMAG